MRKLYLLFNLMVLSVLLSPGTASAQLTITSGAAITATDLANQLVGTGVVVYGATLTCSPTARGIFTGTSSLPFGNGIVLASGNVSSIPAPASTFTSGFMSTPGDPQLTVTAGKPTFDACILEFNFRPTGDTVKFDYVFGSEEYPEWVCSNFNDVFAFYISGPGYGTPTNIALVPGTTVPVSINSVNSAPIGTSYPITPGCSSMGPGSPFSAYYINNSTSTTVVYDGTTTELQAIAAVTPCDTYHLKIGIADGMDAAYDSGVFLKAGSLSSTGLTIVPQGMNPGDTTIGSEYAVRGCQPGRFIFGRHGSLGSPFTIHYTIGGTAVNGYDYTTIADSVVIPAGDSMLTLMINPLLVPAAGPKTVKIYILSPYTCGSTGPIVLDSASLTILDSFFVHIKTSDTDICYGQYVDIKATGDPLLHYSWSPVSTLSTSTGMNPTATPTVTTTYVLTGVFPGGGCPSSSDKITITVWTPPATGVGAPIKKICKGVPLPFNVVTSPTGPWSYLWTPATDLSSAVVANPTVTPSTVGDFWYYVTVGTPVVGCNSRDSFMLHVLPNDFSLISQDTGICYPPSTYQVQALGDTEFTYHWVPNYNVSDPYSLTPMIAPDATTRYTVTGSYPGCPDMVHTILYSIQHPQVDIRTGDTTVCLDIPMPLNVLVTPVDSPYTFNWTPVPANGLVDATVISPYFFAGPGNYTYAVTVHSQLGCTDVDSIHILSAPPVHIVATPGTTTIKYGESIQLDAVRLSLDPLQYMWTPNDGSLDNANINNPMAKPLDSTTYFVFGMNEWGCRDTAQVTILVDQSMSECLPSAFTPNNDGNNDVFKIMCDKHQKLVDFRIFNRWGQLVYENTNNVNKGWDGTYNGEPQDMGVYFYVITIARPGKVNVTYKGEVTLIR